MKKLVLPRTVDLSFNGTIKDNTVRGFVNSYNVNVNNVLAFLGNSACEIENLKNVINPKSVYIAEIPFEIQKKLETGEFQIMKSKDGKYLSNIIDTSLPGNRNIVHQLRLKEEQVNTSLELSNLSNSLNSIAIQQGIANLSKQLSECSLKIDQIKRELRNDKIGQLRGASNNLEQAFLVSENKRESLIFNSISSLNDVRSKFIKCLEEDSKFIDGIKDDKIGRGLQRFFQQVKYNECEEVYHNAQEAYQGILESTILLAVAYQSLGEYKVIEKVFESLDELFDKYGEKYSKLGQIVYTEEYKWHENYNQIKQIKNNFQNNLNLKNFDLIQLEFKGEDLLEQI